MRLRNEPVILGGLFLLLGACNADHRMGDLTRNRAAQDTTAPAATATAASAASDSATTRATSPAPIRNGARLHGYPFSPNEVPADYNSEVWGVDLSHWDGTINWKEVEGESIYFAYLKATEGTDYVDPSFQTNWSEIHHTSLRRGAYHFYLPELPEKEQALQAHNFINTVKKLEPGDLPPMLDVEIDPEISVEQFQSRLLLVIHDIVFHLGVKPIIYTSKELYTKYLTWHGSFQPYEVWIAAYSFTRPELTDKKPMRIWQFTDRAHVRGINSLVDMDIFYTTPDDLANLIVKKQQD
jgi:lysozyme